MDNLKMINKMNAIIEKEDKKNKKKPTQNQIFEKPKKTSSNNKNKKY
tara:strand:+ start:886 stop:1026 length:141 start_codon:yes stop_codon:yes gene_type:complete